ncbi:hypothetical protein ACIBHX_02510 [Nonomuraea sp. NPDC050536]|uniref:hypothetical protein n=1 Tax=Nonomuraea sp. NPDC050536 TaxID=3364366 RepID=UPI0037C89F94
MTIRRFAAGAALATAAGLGLLTISGPAFAGGISVYNRTVHPGGEVCVAAHADTSVYASGNANSPGLKFKLLAQSGLVVPGTSSPGPVTAWAAQTQTGWYNWQGAGDYTACAKNNGTQDVFLSSLIITTS